MELNEMEKRLIFQTETGEGMSEQAVVYSGWVYAATADLGTKPMYHFDSKCSFLAVAYIKETPKEVSGTLYNSLCTGPEKFNCAAEAEPDRKSHSFRFHVSAGISSVLGMFLP